MDEAYAELEENKIEIEKKNKEIIDSIYLLVISNEHYIQMKII